jgi:hypothetical protein
MQRAFKLAIFTKSLGKQGIFMAANIVHGEYAIRQADNGNFSFTNKN